MGKHGKAASEWPGRGHALDRAAGSSMHDYASRGFETPARTDALTTNRRVTARIVREDNGRVHTVYRLNGREYPSLDAIQGRLNIQDGAHRLQEAESPQNSARTEEYDVVNHTPTDD